MNIRVVPAVKSQYQGISGNEKRREFLRGFGWETTEREEETVAVSVTSEFGETYEKYAKMQRERGFSLESFKGKTLTRYIYGVTNYSGESEATVKANILMSGSTVVVGDVCSLRADGFIHGFRRPSDVDKESSQDYNIEGGNEEKTETEDK